MDSLQTDIIAYHGWGLSPDFWGPLKACMPDHIHFYCSDRGYYNHPQTLSFRPDTQLKILITHSFGLHWCPYELIKEADHLIIISGFLHFHPEQEVAERRSKLVLNQMMGRFVEVPKEVVSKFYENMFFPAPVMMDPLLHFDQINHERMLEDLSRINNLRLSIEDFLSLPSIMIIHGEDDAIVSNEKARLLYHHLRYQCQYFEIKQAGHAVPFTHAKQCFEFLNPLLKRFDDE